jgi:hypothetical protein
MQQKVKSAIHLKEAQLFLDECKRTREPVWVVALSKDGTLHRYDGWLVQSGHFTAGTHDLVNPKSGQMRKVRDVLIFYVNGHPIYI